MSSHASSWLEDGVTATVGAGPQQRGQHALEPRQLVLEIGALGAVVDDGALDGNEHLALGAAARLGDEHLEVPHAGAVGRVEPHDERGVLARDRARPAFGAGHQLAGDTHRRVERAAVEPGEERLGDVVAGAHDGRRGGHLDAARAVAPDGVDHAGERGPGDRAGVDARIEGGDAAGHGVDHVGQAVGIDQRGRPAHRVRRVLAARRAGATAALAQHGHHRTPSGELHRPHRDLAQPADTRTDVVAHLTGAGGDEPAEHLPDRRRDRGGLLATGDGHVGMGGPGRGGRFGVLEELGDRVGVGGGAARAARPRHHPTGLPRELEAHDAGFDHLGLGGGGATGRALHVGAVAGDTRSAGATFAGEAQERGGQLAVQVLGVGDDLLPLLTREAAGGDEVLVGVDEQPEQRRAPRRAVGFEHRELLGRRDVVGFELHVEVEGRVVDARRRDLGRGRAVDRGHRQLAIWRAPCGTPEDSVPNTPWHPHPRPASQRRPLAAV